MKRPYLLGIGPLAAVAASLGMRIVHHTGTYDDFDDGDPRRILNRRGSSSRSREPREIVHVETPKPLTKRQRRRLRGKAKGRADERAAIVELIEGRK